MYVTQLSLRDFRNYERLDLGLEPGITLFYGPNAAGKTSILEALFYLATTRSTRAGADRELVRCRRCHGGRCRTGFTGR